MYKVTSGAETVGYSDTVVYVRLHSNGCYVPCEQEDAEGFCVKSAVSHVNEDGVEQTVLQDVVYKFGEGWLKGDEPTGTLDAVSGTITLAEADKIISIILAAERSNITAEKAQQLRTVIEQGVTALDLSPEDALAAVELYPAWETGKAFTVGERIRHEGKLYDCIQSHTAQIDWVPGGGAVSLWNEITIDPATGYDEWQQPTGAHDAYNTGDRVVFGGVVYESTIDGNSWSPEAYPAGWRVAN